MENLKEEIKKLIDEGFSEYEAHKILLLSYAISLAHIVRLNNKSLSYRQEDAIWIANTIIELDKLSSNLLLKGRR